MIKYLKEFIEKKIDTATLERSPFPHMVIEDFFPAEIYSKMLEYNPFNTNAGEEWLSKEASGNVSSRTPYHARKQINFHKNVKTEMSAEASLFWDQIKTCFLKDHWFENVVIGKYRDYFQLRFGDFTDVPDFAGHFEKQLFLQRHEPGYYIGPHTDIPTRVFTCIFSFASTTGFEEYGTELLAHKDRKVRCSGHDHYDPADFIVRKVAPYRPNNFLLFFKTRQSFHSVRAITKDVPNQRYGMQFQFYEPSGGIFKDLSDPDLMVLKQKTVVAPAVPSALVAVRPTFLKVSIAKSVDLSDEKKVGIREGDIIECQKPEMVGDHLRLVSPRLNGQALAGIAWFVYAPHWQTRVPVPA